MNPKWLIAGAVAVGAYLLWRSSQGAASGQLADAGTTSGLDAFAGSGAALGDAGQAPPAPAPAAPPRRVDRDHGTVTIVPSTRSQTGKYRSTVGPTLPAGVLLPGATGTSSGATIPPRAIDKPAVRPRGGASLRDDDGPPSGRFGGLTLQDRSL